MTQQKEKMIHWKPLFQAYHFFFISRMTHHFPKLGEIRLRSKIVFPKTAQKKRNGTKTCPFVTPPPYAV